jgi:hypothetical protein
MPPVMRAAVVGLLLAACSPERTPDVSSPSSSSAPPSEPGSAAAPQLFTPTRVYYAGGTLIQGWLARPDLVVATLVRGESDLGVPELGVSARKARTGLELDFPKRPAPGATAIVFDATLLLTRAAGAEEHTVTVKDSAPARLTTLGHQVSVAIASYAEGGRSQCVPGCVEIAGLGTLVLRQQARLRVGDVDLSGGELTADNPAPDEPLRYHLDELYDAVTVSFEVVASGATEELALHVELDRFCRTCAAE